MRIGLVAVLLMVCTVMASVLQADLNMSNTQRFDSALIGNWAGSLTYRDYATNEFVKLPTTLAVSKGAGVGVISLSFVFNDGPNKIVKDTLTLTIDRSGKQATIIDGTNTPQVCSINALNTFPKTGIVILTSEGTDNDRPAEIRETVTVTNTTFDYLREVAPKGTSRYLFRHEYNFERVVSKS